MNCEVCGIQLPWAVGPSRCEEHQIRHEPLGGKPTSMLSLASRVEELERENAKLLKDIFEGSDKTRILADENARLREACKSALDELLESGYHWPNETVAALMEVLGIPEPGDE